MRLALLLVLVLGSACVTTKSEGEAMRKDIDGLRASFEQDKKEARAERERLRSEQAKAVKELADALDALNRAARKTGADLAVDLEKAQGEVATLKGQIEVFLHKMEGFEKGLAERDKKLDDVHAWKLARDKAMQAAEHPTEKGAIYKLALQKIDAGDTARARELLTGFLSKFGSDPFAPNAQYWLGETYYAERRFNDAIVEFQKVLKDWKKSEKTPDALLKIGMSFQAQNDCKNAVLFFDEVVAAHRNSTAAKTAKERLKECRGKKASQR